MSKPNKEQIQKIVMGVLVVLGILYGFFAFLLGPVKKSTVSTEKGNTELVAKIKEADKQIRRAQTLDGDAVAAAEKIDLIGEYMPSGAPIAWFPPRVKRFFKRHGFKDVVVRMSGEQPFTQEELADYRQLSWTIQLQEAGFVPFGIALAALENEEPFLEITQIEISASLENPEFQRISFVARTILKK